MSLPPCGLYRTNATVAGVPAGRLVYFHNHGDPGAGVYLPARWQQNHAQFEPRGHTLQSESEAEGLESVPPEGLYVVENQFWCCEQRCRSFEADLLVQLGYNGAADPIIFVPTFDATGMAIPQRGSKTSLKELTNLRQLRVAKPEAAMAVDGLPN